MLTMKTRLELFERMLSDVRGLVEPRLRNIASPRGQEIVHHSQTVERVGQIVRERDRLKDRIRMIEGGMQGNQGGDTERFFAQEDGFKPGSEKNPFDMLSGPTEPLPTGSVPEEIVREHLTKQIGVYLQLRNQTEELNLGGIQPSLQLDLLREIDTLLG